MFGYLMLCIATEVIELATWKRVSQNTRAVPRDRRPNINTPSHNTFFLLRHFVGVSPEQLDRGDERRCDDRSEQEDGSVCEKSVQSTVD